jgi:hypothetical protein
VAPRPDAAPRPDSVPRTETAAAYGAAPSSAAPAPNREPAPLPRPPESSPQSAAGNDSKYVVWSSAPSDVPRSGPDDR